MHVIRRAAVVLATLTIAAIGLSAPLGADPAQEPRVELRNLKVVDQAGNPFPEGTAGVIACPVEGWSVPCTDLLVGNADADGVARMTVNPNIEYRFSGFVFGTGWPCPSFVSEDGTEFHFSDATDAFGRELARPTTFFIHEPDPADCAPPSVDLTLTVLDGAGNPFPEGTAGTIACPTDGSGDCRFGSADANGVAVTTVDANIEYAFTAFVFGTGWPCPSFVSEDGTEFHFSEAVVALGSELGPTTFFIHEPAPSECLV